MSNKTFRAVLFYVLIAIFLASVTVTILGLIGGDRVHVDQLFLKTMMGALILEPVAAVIAFWKQLTGEHLEDPPDVSGKWEYLCIREDDTYKHGGDCEIKIKKAAFGWEFSIQGKRRWMASKHDGVWKEEKLIAIASWNDTWGTFTGSDSLRYAYSVNIRGKVVNGYGWATIANQGTRPIVMEGNFYQLPPHDPFYGYQIYWRPGSRPGHVQVPENCSLKEAPVSALGE